MTEKPIAVYQSFEFSVYILNNENGFVRYYIEDNGKKGRITTSRINRDDEFRDYFVKNQMRFYLDEFKQIN